MKLPSSRATPGISLLSLRSDSSVNPFGANTRYSGARSGVQAAKPAIFGELVISFESLVQASAHSNVAGTALGRWPLLTPERRQIIGPKLGSFWQEEYSVRHGSALRFLAALRRLVSAQRSYRSIDARYLRSLALTARPSIGSPFSHCWARITWICASWSWAQAKCCAAICCSSITGAPVNAPTIVMIFSTANESGCPGRDRPCLNALRLEFCFPAAVLGPVLRFT